MDWGAHCAWNWSQLQMHVLLVFPRGDTPDAAWLIEHGKTGSISVTIRSGDRNDAVPVLQSIIWKLSNFAGFLHSLFNTALCMKKLFYFSLQWQARKAPNSSLETVTCWFDLPNEL